MYYFDFVLRRALHLPLLLEEPEVSELRVARVVSEAVKEGVELSVETAQSILVSVVVMDAIEQLQLPVFDRQTTNLL